MTEPNRYSSIDLNDDQARISFLTLNYELLAAVAWKGYLEEGRGCVVIDNEPKHLALEKRSFKAQWNLDTIGGFYLGENSNNFHAFMQGMWPDAETKHRVANYDPLSKVLVLVWFGSDKGDFLVQGISIPQLPPPLCYQRLLPRLKEFTVPSDL
ncbi:MAG TPA: hypothetical protein DCE56_14510 [Cyanobacteria bacterium UBA8553]|nr:hypothetical protein [Cyanobacteria bacterium UBA8553]